jgi:hypothetical protein
MAEIEDNITGIEFPPEAKAAPAEAQPTPEHSKAADDARHHKPGARTAFHLTNFLGLHMIFNSTTSVLIAYNLLTMNFAKKMITGLGDSLVGKAAYHVFSAPAKVMTAGMKLFSPKFRETLEKQPVLNEAEKLIQRRHSARSAVETAFMCIAGFIALWPVKYMEDHRVGFLNKVDNWLHPGRSKEEKENLALRETDEPKETWTNLLRARFVALAAVFSVDAIQQNINSIIGYAKGTRNLDTMAWHFGAKISDTMDKHPGSTTSKVRSWLVNFFDRKGVKLNNVQEMMRDHLLEHIDSPQALKDASARLKVLSHEKELHHTNEALVSKLDAEIKSINEGLKKTHPKELERIIFAEQSRLLFTKELWLTTVMSIVIYTAAKAPFMAKFFEKVGLKHKGHNEKDQGTFTLPSGVQIPMDGVGNDGLVPPEQTQWSNRVSKKQQAAIKPEPKTSFQAALMEQAREQNPEAALSV